MPLKLSEAGESLRARLQSREARCAVIGLGYVGLPLIVEFARAGSSVVGIDVDPTRVEEINRGTSYIGDVPTEILKPLVEAGRIQASLPGEILGEVDTVCICVPTPLTRPRIPTSPSSSPPPRRWCAICARGSSSCWRAPPTRGPPKR